MVDKSSSQIMSIDGRDNHHKKRESLSIVKHMRDESSTYENERGQL